MLKITLREARIRSGFTKAEVVELCDMSSDAYDQIEINPGAAELSVIRKISSIINVPLCAIYPGTKADCAKYNRSQARVPTTPDHILTTQLSKTRELSSTMLH